ncbi:hypothetical protein QBC35DRAFT_271463 [Podospora australis]|uniref:Uncharacterized protein n=1 Tax=Podospora australis TaxID=1536484 RepID=A0AAN6WRW7_9PEZI|nr:hypothetical protein QBC35DRAFT_271463 [Podospora australis]
MGGLQSLAPRRPSNNLKQSPQSLPRPHRSNIHPIRLSRPYALHDRPHRNKTEWSRNFGASLCSLSAYSTVGDQLRPYPRANLILPLGKRSLKDGRRGCNPFRSHHTQTAEEKGRTVTVTVTSASLPSIALPGINPAEQHTNINTNSQSITVALTLAHTHKHLSPLIPGAPTQNYHTVLVLACGHQPRAVELHPTNRRPPRHAPPQELNFGC